MKNFVFFLYFMILLGSFQVAAGGSAREIAKTDLTHASGKGEVELYLNYILGSNPVSIYVNGTLAAQCFGPSEDGTVQLEKIIAQEGTARLDAVIKQRRTRKNQKGDDERYWHELHKQSLNLILQTSPVTLDIATNGERFTKLEIQNRLPPAPQPEPGGIEGAVKNAGKKMVEKLPENATLAIVSVRSADDELSEYIIEELEYVLVNARGTHFKIVDRKSLDRIRSEQNFQMSGEVDDGSAISIGKFLGATVVITGNITGSKDLRRLRIKALDVLTAEVVVNESERF